VLLLISRIVSLVIAIGYVVAMVIAEHGLTKDSLLGGAILLLPLALIWFPEELGSYTGLVTRGGQIDTETPLGLVSAMGWFFLVGFPLLIYFLTKR
jgi:hypothetical protein